MADVRVKLKRKAIRELLRSAPVQAEVARTAKRMASSAGEGFEAVIKPHKYTSRAFIQTADNTGKMRQARDAVLERLLGLPPGTVSDASKSGGADAPRADGKMLYTTNSGKKMWASPEQILHWTRAIK